MCVTSPPKEHDEGSQNAREAIGSESRRKLDGQIEADEEDDYHPPHCPPLKLVMCVCVCVCACVSVCARGLDHRSAEAEELKVHEEIKCIHERERHLRAPSGWKGRCVLCEVS